MISASLRGELLYGEYPVSVLQELYATKGERISKKQIVESFDNGSMMVCDGEMVSPIVVTDREMLKLFREADASDNPYASLHLDPTELKVLRKENAVIRGISLTGFRLQSRSRNWWRMGIFDLREWRSWRIRSGRPAVTRHV